ncbi:MAG TPA: hypothetical protein VN517_18340, partial [Terriglobales bacterium]|nr:hypothetical protein [Terriglobales bacterium]
MKPILRFVIVVLMSTLAVSQTLTPPQAITDPKKITSKPDANVEQGEEGLSLERLYMTRQIGGTAWSPDGKSIVFVSNITGRNNLWLVSSEGGWPAQLTVSDQRQSSPTWSPNGKWIAYQSDYDGDEQWDIFLVSPKTGQVVNVTKTREISEENPVWSPDGRYLAYVVKPKTSSVFEIDVFDTLLRDVKHITSNTPANKLNTNPIWSKDGRVIAYTQEDAKGTDSNIFVADVKTGKSILATPHEGEKLFAANNFSPDGKALLITSNAANEFQNAGLLDLATKKIKWVTDEKWEIYGGNFSPDGRSLTFRANVDGHADLYMHDLVSQKTTELPLSKGVNSFGGAESAFSQDGKKLLYYHNGANAPGDAWTYDIETGKSTQVTRSLMAGVPADHMVEPLLVHYHS